MNRQQLLSEAKIILQRLNDHPNSIWFHFKAIKMLGFQKCYELASLALDEYRVGNIRTTPARYYNGCVMREIKGYAHEQ